MNVKHPIVTRQRTRRGVRLGRRETAQTGRPRPKGIPYLRGIDQEQAEATTQELALVLV